MVKAVWNGKVIAEADRTEIVEGNHYFPCESLRGEFFQPSNTHSICPWKGTISLFSDLRLSWLERDKLRQINKLLSF